MTKFLSTMRIREDAAQQLRQSRVDEELRKLLTERYWNEYFEIKKNRDLSACGLSLAHDTSPRGPGKARILNRRRTNNDKI